MIARRLLLALAACGAGVVGGSAQAGELLIAPTTVQLEAGRRSAAIEITNAADEPIDLQFRAYAWDQPDGVERLVPTEALAISPPIASLPPHGKQVFRVLDMSEPTATAERSYRLKLNGIPRVIEGAVAINLEFSLPVFRTPTGAAPALTWAGSTRPEIRLSNQGGRRTRIVSLALRQADGVEVPIPAAASSYILIGSAKTFAIPDTARIAPGARLVGVGDFGVIDVLLPVLAAR